MQFQFVAAPPGRHYDGAHGKSGDHNLSARRRRAGRGDRLADWLAQRRPRPRPKIRQPNGGSRISGARRAEQLAALKESFKALSADALKEAQPELVRLAGETLGKLHESAKGELNTSKEAVAKLVAPLTQHLATYQQRLSESEKSRNTQLGALREQLSTLSENSKSLSSETEQLRMILNSSQARGKWGEETLRRVVEAAGLSSHCDFSEQTGSAEGRPDMIVHLPEGRHIVVDAKSPDLSFLNDLESGTQRSAKRPSSSTAKKCAKPSRRWPTETTRSTSTERSIAW